MPDWMILHEEVINDFLLFLNLKSNEFILKGGTSLVMCYELDRFSENIALDGFDKLNFFKIVDLFVQCYKGKYNSLSYRKPEDTDITKSVLIYYGGSKPLRVEVSYMRKTISKSEFRRINHIFVYTPQSILSMKLDAFLGRGKIRDLYDIVFIYLNYKPMLSKTIIFMLRDAVAFKGLEQFNYLIQNQHDDLINNDSLARRFSTMYYDLGLS